MRSFTLMFAVVVVLAGGTAVGQERFGLRVERSSAGPVEIDERKAVFRITVPEDQGYGDREGPAEAPIVKSLAALRERESGLFVSVAVLEAAAKRFDDRLYASIETLLSNGHEGAFRGKAALFSALLERIGDGSEEEREARTRLVAALSLLAREVGSSDARRDAKRLVQAFEADPLRSKPLGFYTWTEELARGFRSDRFLQEVVEIERGGAWLRALGNAVASEPSLRADYERILRVAARLSNPLAAPDALTAALGDVGQGAFLPASRTREGELFKQLYGQASIPPGRDLMDDYIAAIRKGAVSLTPGRDSGWYDYQSWALESLVNEKAALEAAKIKRDPRYAKLCEEVFKATLTKRRETHVKQLEAPTCGAAMPQPPKKRIVTLRPALHLEPQLTYLRRTADAYAFVRQELVAIFGEAVLAAAPLYALDGTPASSILDSLRDQEAKFRSFAAIVAAEIGADPALLGSGVDEAEAERLASLGREALHPTSMKADLEYDPRVMVPVAYDVERKLVRCWAVVGVASRPAWIGYETRPSLVVRDGAGNALKPAQYEVDQEVQWIRLPYEVWIECAVKAPLSREEFRSLCDRHTTASAIKAALEAR